MILRSKQMYSCCHRQIRLLSRLVGHNGAISSLDYGHDGKELETNRKPCVGYHSNHGNRGWRTFPATRIHRAEQSTSASSNTCLSATVPYTCSSRFSCLQRGYASGQSSMMCSPLKDRSLLRAAGRDTTDFLQGLITNDMRMITHQEFDEIPAQVAMYAMLLNIQGRVLYDLIVYRMNKDEESPVYLLECESQVVSDLLKVMKKYKLRKKVDLSVVGDEYKVWAVTPGGDTTHSPQMINLNLSSSAVDLHQEAALDTSASGHHIRLEGDSHPGAVIVRDPRVSTFGHRLVLTDGYKASDILEGTVDAADAMGYHRRRYVWGVSEGLVDLPPGNSLPLESNLVFMNGVSFSKGCYIGQELTARTHHTGVIRKRLLPITISSSDSDITPGDKVENQSGKNCGKFRNAVDSHGLALLRIGDVLGKGPLVVKNSDGESAAEVLPTVPAWWPKESDHIIQQAIASASKQ